MLVTILNFYDFYDNFILTEHRFRSCSASYNSYFQDLYKNFFLYIRIYSYVHVQNLEILNFEKMLSEVDTLFFLRIIGMLLKSKLTKFLI